ncbi:Enoyl-CoA delta isomerase 2, mitochondrial, partial [Trichinella papuae]
LRFFQNFMIKAAFSVVRMAPLRTLQELRMNTERAVEIGRAFEFQYKAQVPEQNTNILYVENWVPVFNRQFTDLNAHYVPSVLLEVLKQNGQEKCNLSDKVAVLLRKEPMHEVCFCTLHFYCVEKWSTVSTESYGKWLCPSWILEKSWPAKSSGSHPHEEELLAPAVLNSPARRNPVPCVGYERQCEKEFTQVDPKQFIFEVLKATWNSLQATVGPCETDKPSSFDVVNLTKWKVWSSLLILNLMYRDIMDGLKATEKSDAFITVFEGEYFCSGYYLNNLLVKPTDRAKMAADAKLLLRDFVGTFIDYPEVLIATVNVG